MTPLKLIEKIKNEKIDENDKIHIIDYLEAVYEQDKDYEDLNNFSTADLISRSNMWLEHLIEDLKEYSTGKVSIIGEFKTTVFVKLEDQESYSWEGQQLNHCVQQYYNKKESDIYSLRKKEGNIPVCTIEVKNDNIIQVQGRGNGKVPPKYIKDVIQGLVNLNLEIKSSLINLGYIKLTPYLEKNINSTFNNAKIIHINNSHFLYLYNEIKFKKPFKLDDSYFSEVIWTILEHQPNHNLFDEMYNQMCFKEEELLFYFIMKNKLELEDYLKIQKLQLKLYSKTKEMINSRFKEIKLIEFFFNAPENVSDEIGLTGLSTIFPKQLDFKLKNISFSDFHCFDKYRILYPEKFFRLVYTVFLNMSFPENKTNSYKFLFSTPNIFNVLVKLSSEEFNQIWTDSNLNSILNLNQKMFICSIKVIEIPLLELYKRDKNYMFQLVYYVLNQLDFEESSYKSFLEKINYKKSEVKSLSSIRVFY